MFFVEKEVDILKLGILVVNEKMWEVMCENEVIELIFKEYDLFVYMF